MSATKVAGLRAWVVAGLGAVAVVLLGVALFRFPAPPDSLHVGTMAPAVKKPVQIARPSLTPGGALKDEMEIRDLRPLFLPTRFNATLPEVRLEAGRSFLENEATGVAVLETKLNVADNLPPTTTLNGKELGPVDLPEVSAKPLDALVADQPRPLTGFGRTTARITPLRERGGFVEAAVIATGEKLLADELAVEARPRGDKPWEPVEFQAVVNAAGLVVPLVVTKSSGVDEVDAHFRNFLARSFRIGQRLPAGFYRITVAP